MQPKVSKLVNYVRNPTWISMNFCADKTKDGGNFAYTEEERRRFRGGSKGPLRGAQRAGSQVSGTITRA